MLGDEPYAFWGLMMPSASSDRPRHPGFTLLELLVVVAIISLLVSILLPSLVHARAQSRRAACGAQEHAMGLALAMYTLEMRYYPGDHLHREPGQLGFSSSLVTWMPRLVRYMGDEHRTFWCPDAPEDTRWDGKARPVVFLSHARPGEQATFAYGYNAWGVRDFSYPQWGLGGHVRDPQQNAFEASWNQGELKVEQVKRPSDMIAIVDSGTDAKDSSPGIWDELVSPMKYPGDPGRQQLPGERHSRGANVLYCDGHIEWTLRKKLVEPSKGMRQRWNNDFRDHCMNWADRPSDMPCEPQPRDME